ncbi:MAG: aminotransferase class IV [Deltaproteobacteria bacterium]|nr:aminotransferase class IV [Deltaproteobacteria bacterium]
MAEDAPTGVAWIDGRVTPLSEARVPVTDRGFLFADSVFDTVRTYEELPFLLGDHLDRLRRSAAALSMPVPWTDDELLSIVGMTINQRGFAGESSLRVMLTRGDGGSGLSFPEPQRPRLVVLCRPVPGGYASMGEAGVHLVRPSRHQGKGGVLGHIKSGDYLDNLLALNEGRRSGGMEALMLGADGSWGEATTSNLFAVSDGVVTTPGLEAGILPGITRALVMHVLTEEGLSLTEASLHDAHLEGADELFITSSLKEVMPAVGLDGQPVGAGEPGPLTTQLRERFAGAVQRIQRAGYTRLSEAFPC